jgi:hypothetical protein
VQVGAVADPRHQSRLRHLGVGRRHAGPRVVALVADRNVHVINEDGELLTVFTIDPARDKPLIPR